MSQDTPHQTSMFPDDDNTMSPSHGNESPSDWGEASETFDEITQFVTDRDLTLENEAQTRFDVIDRMIRDVLGWTHGQVKVEEGLKASRHGYVDYILRSGDNVIVIEAKRIGATFPVVTRRAKLKLTGSVLGQGEVKEALDQADYYAREKEADVVVVTNGVCWIFYAAKIRDAGSYAHVLFPFSKDGQAEQLYNFFAVTRVEENSLEGITNQLPPIENRLSSVIANADGRVDRNNIADFIVPALNKALYKNAIINDLESLEKCFVTTEARVKFDRSLQMHLVDLKPTAVTPAERIDRGKSPDQLEEIIERSVPSQAPPVTVIIGPVGAGKTTYLRHFEFLSGYETLTKNQIHWIYIDFAGMGTSVAPRKFIYEQLLEYIERDHPRNPTDWKNLIEPAYKDIINSLARGPYYKFYISDKDRFNEKVIERIEKDMQDVEPYVNRLLRHITGKKLCVVVLDNVDLFEDTELETTVFAEGLALSEVTHCNVIVSLRDTTFVRHQSDSTFNAYQLRKLWLDPPPFKEVLSARLSYSKKILENKPAKIPLSNNMVLDLPDLSVFFDIVQKSLLSQQTGDFIDRMSNMNIRNGLELVHNFLTSGHIQADRAIKNYMDGTRSFTFPFHEIFKGAILGQWKYYQERKSQHCLNLFDAKLASSRLRLLRLQTLIYLFAKSRYEQVEVPVLDCRKFFSVLGASENHVVTCLKDLSKYGLIRSASAEIISIDNSVVITRTGGYYLQILSKRFVYLESCLFDTAIEDEEIWQEIYSSTQTIELQNNIYKRMQNRVARIKLFLGYLETLEADILSAWPNRDDLTTIPAIRDGVVAEAAEALKASKRIIERQK